MPRTRDDEHEQRRSRAGTGSQLRAKQDERDGDERYDDRGVLLGEHSEKERRTRDREGSPSPLPARIIERRRD